MKQNEKTNAYNISFTSIAGIKKINEDACWVGINKTNQCLGIVCDGIGSQEGSQNVSRFMVEYFQKEFNKKRHILFPELWFKKTLYAAWKALKTKYLKVKSQMGTTLALVLISKDKVFCFHIGDSRVYHYSSITKEWIKKTKDHNLYNVLLDKNASEEIFIKNKNNLLSLTNFIDSQTDQYMKYTLTEFKINKTYNILLCSDGLYNFLKINKINNVIFLCQIKDFDSIASRLAQEALTNGSNDNISCILIELKKPR